MDHKTLLGTAFDILHDRDGQYGPADDGFARACGIFKLVTGIELTMYQASMFLHCLKLSRIHQTPEKLDNYVDGINYLAFAGEFIGAENEPAMSARAMASKLSPIFRDEITGE
jgi:hypothetical protein